jgi:hypothetical protein
MIIQFDRSREVITDLGREVEGYAYCYYLDLFDLSEINIYGLFGGTLVDAYNTTFFRSGFMSY